MMNDMETRPSDSDDQDEVDPNLEDEMHESPIEKRDYDITTDDGEDQTVGAVKIRPGEMQDDDNDQAGANNGSAYEERSDTSNANGDSDLAWEEPADTHGEVECDQPQNISLYYRQDEHYVGEDFEPFVACLACGTDSHQKCARDEDALDRSDDNGAHWTCPECKQRVAATTASANIVHHPHPKSKAGILGKAGGSMDPAHSFARHVSVLPAPSGTDSRFGPPVIEDDGSTGSLRPLRKRKTSLQEDASLLSALRKRRPNARAVVDTAKSSLQSQTPRPGFPGNSLVEVKVQPSQGALIVKFRIAPSLLARLVPEASMARPTQKRATRRAALPRPIRSGHSPVNSRSGHGGLTGKLSAEHSLPDIMAPFIPSAFSQPFYSFFDKETDEMKGKPYGGVLTDFEADTSKTLPLNDDRCRFDDAKRRAEEEWKGRVLAMRAAAEMPLRKAKKAARPASQIQCIEFGGWEIDTWYAAPYPEEYSRNRILYICEFCLKYMNSDYVAWRHKLKCPVKHPPGDEIYRAGPVSVFEVDGRKNPVYCQNLCLLAKLFLGSKTLYYDVEPFLFYVLCEFDHLGYHFVGYFSKEKRASSQNNVSCILTLPIHQRKGYGNLLIDFSYLLTRVERKNGSPEKPLSDMGLVSYRNYWRLVMCQYLLAHAGKHRPPSLGDDDGEHEPQLDTHAGSYGGLSIRRISNDTGLTPDDVVSALEGLRCLVRDPQSGLYGFRVDLGYCQEYVAKWEAKNYVRLDPSALTWTPYVTGRTNIANFELGPSLTATAPRDEAASGPHLFSLELGAIEGTKNTTAGSGACATASAFGEIDAQAGPFVSHAVVVRPTERETELDTLSPKTHNSSYQGALMPMPHAPSHGQLPLQPPPEPMLSGHSHHSWASPYRRIPPTRFQIFPPISSTRRTDRTRVTTPRPSAFVQNNPSAPKRTPARSSGILKRYATSSGPAPSKRKTGGTGRGPGRWPKGTKKSDYGNAESGPGLPPAWIRARQEARERQERETREEIAEAKSLRPSGPDCETDTSWMPVGAEVHSTSRGPCRGITPIDTCLSPATERDSVPAESKGGNAIMEDGSAP